MTMASLVTAAKFYANHTAAWGPGRRTVMLAFAGGACLTDREIATKYNMKPSTVRPRRVELWRLGFLTPVGMVQRGRQRVQVWCASPTGHAEINRLTSMAAMQKEDTI